MSARVKKALNELQTAKCPEDIFGELKGDKLVSLNDLYKNWAKKIHPDLCAKSEKSISEEAFKLLGQLLEQARKKIKDGTYGDKNSLINRLIVNSAKNSYSLNSIFASGDVSDLFRGENGKDKIIAKICRSPANNHLLKIEAERLKWLKEESPSKDLKILQHLPERNCPWCHNSSSYTSPNGGP